MTEDKDPWGRLLLAGLMKAVEEAVPVATDAVYHLVGKGGGTAWLIEDITSIIVGVGDKGDGVAYIALFGLEWCVDAAHTIVEVVVKGAWSLPCCLKECRFPIG